MTYDYIKEYIFRISNLTEEPAVGRDRRVDEFRGSPIAIIFSDEYL